MLQHLEGMKIVNTVAAELTKRQKAAVVAVSDSYGELIALLRIGDVPLSSIRIAMNKAWTAAREHKATKEIGEKVKHPESGHDIAYYGDPNYVGWGGGLPISKNGEVVGAIAVSGLSSSEDAALAALGVELIAAS